MDACVHVSVEVYAAMGRACMHTHTVTRTHAPPHTQVTMLVAALGMAGGGKNYME